MCGNGSGPSSLVAPMPTGEAFTTRSKCSSEAGLALITISGKASRNSSPSISTRCALKSLMTR
ncbi:hypothetical protein D3C75_1351970 [compost metagenome]